MDQEKYHNRNWTNRGGCDNNLLYLSGVHKKVASSEIIDKVVSLEEKIKEKIN